MAYVVKIDVTAKIPPQYLTEALDDDGDGAEDAGLFDQIVTTASNDVDGYLAGLFTTPFSDPAPAQVRAAALIFVCEAIYARRVNAGESNPFKAQGNFWRERLQQIGDRKLPLDSGAEGKPVAAAKAGSAPRIPSRFSPFEDCPPECPPQ